LTNSKEVIEKRTETGAPQIKMAEIMENPQNGKKNIGFIGDWRNLQGQVSSAETVTNEKESS